MSILDTYGARWMWPSDAVDGPNQYVQFRQEFSLDSVEADARLYISADSDYTVWVNGAFAGCGQWHNYPDAKTYDTLDVSALVKPGRNVLCALVWYRGIDSLQYIADKPGLIYAVETGAARIASGPDATYRLKTGYRNGPIQLVTMQLGQGFEYDARPDDDWLSESYAPTSDWSAITSTDLTAADSRGELSARPIAKLDILDRASSRVVAHGLFTRGKDDPRGVSELMQTDFLSARPYHLLFSEPSGNVLPSDGGLVVNAASLEDSSGFYVVIDLGREDVGFFDLDITAEAGTFVDVAWGEHLDDLRVRAAVGGRNFAFRYTCAAGLQSFTNHFLRLGGRYIQLHVSGISKQFVLHYVGILPCPYPIVERGSFTSPDNFQKRIYDISVRTLHLCMHEHYEDCPWREQGLYANDSRNQALCGYYCFGDYAFPAAAFDLLGRGLKDDGFLELCAPGKLSITIPGFTMAWVQEVADHLMYSGDLDSASRQMPRIASILDHCATNLKAKNLLLSPKGERFWHFYDWAPGLDGTDQTGFHKLQRDRWDAPFNLWYCLALDAVKFISETLGLSDAAHAYALEADAIRSAFHQTFWDTEKGVYRTFVGEGAPDAYNELTQAMALLAGVCPADKAAALRAKLATKDNGLVETTLSQSLYKFEALLGEPDIYAGYVFDKIEADWGYMLSRGATSFWETIKGGDDFGNAGSLCHGWSGIPVYFYHAYLLGIKPTKPGFREYEFRPVQGIVKEASGKVPTPHGCIIVSWEERDGQVSSHLSGPDQCIVVV